MEEITLFVSIVIIVFGVLQIILFFKLWGMTNNVKEIKESLPKNVNGISPAKIEFAIGHIEKAKELAKREFITDVCKIYREIISTGYSRSEYEINVYDKEYKKIESDYRDCFIDSYEYIDYKRFDTFDKAKSFFK